MKLSICFSLFLAVTGVATVTARHHKPTFAPRGPPSPAPSFSPLDDIVDFEDKDYYKHGMIAYTLSGRFDWFVYERFAYGPFEVEDWGTVTGFSEADKALFPAKATVFESDRFTKKYHNEVDRDLGTPHSDFGGVGIGTGGGKDSLYPNDKPRGNLLVVADAKTWSRTIPSQRYNFTVNPYGGVIFFWTLNGHGLEYDWYGDYHAFHGAKYDNYYEYDSVHSIGLVHGNHRGMNVTVWEGHDFVYGFSASGRKPNSYELIPIHTRNVTLIEVFIHGKAGVSHLNLEANEGYRCPTLETIDFSSFAKGTRIKTIRPGIKVSTKKRIRGFYNSTKLRLPRVIDTSKPPLNNTYLGAPHKAFGGPGKGRGGKKGWNQNTVPQGMALTYSGKIRATIANNISGAFIFEFDTPTSINSIGILNNMFRLTVVARNVEGGVTEIVSKGTEGSFEDIKIWQPAIVQLVVKGNGVFAITYLELGKCPEDHVHRNMQGMGEQIYEEDEYLADEDPAVDENEALGDDPDPMEDADYVY